MAGANYVSFIEAQAKGTAQFKILAEGVTCKPNTFGVAALPSSGITKPADLAGKTVAVTAGTFALATWTRISPLIALAGGTIVKVILRLTLRAKPEDGIDPRIPPTASR